MVASMSNLIQAAKEEVAVLAQRAYEAAAAKGELPAGLEVAGTVEIPKDASFGDYASGFAMAAARLMKLPPRTIGERLLNNLDLKDGFFQSAELAGPGFLNLRLSDRWYAAVLADIEREGELYGKVDLGAGQRVMVEFVSANPTGTMTIGNARGGVLGDALASVLERAGYEVWREF
jgi:arginyl-tRNA synthetase